MPRDDASSGAAIDLSVPRVVHVVGIGGAGMSAIATVLARMGHQVSGSDLKESPTLERLRALGIDARVGHSAEHLPADLDALILSTAIPRSNPEVAAADERGVRVLRRAEALGALAATRRAIAVAGSHGKTTTSSMLALVLRAAGWRPSFLIGGDLNEVGTNAAYDDGEWLVVEADESDGTFLELAPDAGIVTNVEADHLDHYGDFDGLVDAFRRFLGGPDGVQPGGLRVVSADDEILRTLAADDPDIVTFGVSDDARYRLADYRGARQGSSFDLVRRGELLGTIELPVPGHHNAMNAAAAGALALELGVPFDAVRTALAGFGGVARRFQFRGVIDGVTLVDDYAHIPGEVSAMIRAAREGDWARVVVVFQPHRYSRTARLWRDFADSFTGADAVVLTDIYPAGEVPQPGVSGRLVLRAVLDAHPSMAVSYLPRRADVVGHALDHARPGDLVLTLGAGDLSTVPDEWLARAGSCIVNLDDVAAALTRSLGDRVTRDAPIADLTTYRLGGPAAVLVRVLDDADLRAVASVVARERPPVLVIGRGSNLLVADRGFPGVAIVLGGSFEELTVSTEAGDVGVRAGAATPLPVVARRSAATGLTGLEFLVGIPGSVGGAVRMNAGGHGRETAEVLVSATVVDLSQPDAPVRELDANALALGYRTSALGPSDLVTGAHLRAVIDDVASAEERLAEVVRWRREHQPGGANAGSVFRNPPDDSAGRLIDAAGLKGLRVGGAIVSPKHANFFQAEAGATADDVHRLVRTVRARVADAEGVLLEPELRMIGFDDAALEPGVTR